MHLAQELVASQHQLASLPNLYYRIREALNDPNIGIPELAGIISVDPALSATLLQIANSAFYGFPRKIETLSRAIALIGFDQVGEVVLAGTLASAFHGIRPQRMDMHRFWCGSIRRALLNRQFARNLGLREPERAFITGLLADMGHLVMYHAVPDLIGIVLEMPAAGLGELAEKERAIIGCDFCEVGAALASAWHLPANIGYAIGAQLDPLSAGEEEAADAARLCLAVSVAEALGAGETIGAGLPLIHEDAAILSSVDLSLLPVFAEHCEEQLESVMRSLGVR